MLQLVLAMGGQGQIGWAATSMLPPAALGLAGASWRMANGKKLTTAWRSKQHCRYSVARVKATVNAGRGWPREDRYTDTSGLQPGVSTRLRPPREHKAGHEGGREAV